jgi:hypothetical protein
MPFSSLAAVTSSMQYMASLLSLNRTRKPYITETQWQPGHPVGANTLRATIKETPSTTRSNYIPLYCLVVTHVKKKLREALLCLGLGCVGKGVEKTEM